MLGLSKNGFGLTRLLLLASAGALVACAQAEPGGADACVSGLTCISNVAPGVDAGTGSGQYMATSYDSGASSAAASDLPCDVKAIVDTHCVSCHTPQGLAPMTLASRADFLKPSPKAPPMTVAQSVATRVHSTDTKTAMPPAGYDKLTSTELAALDAWLNAGAPARTGGSCGGTAPIGTDGGVAVDGGGAPFVPGDLECFKLLAHAQGSKTAKYRVGSASDRYVNMTFAAPWGAGTRYAVSIKPITDNAKVLHHWLVFQDLGSGSDGSVVQNTTGAHPGGQLLAAWAPGGTGIDLSPTPDLGYELPGGAQTYTLEFHYNSTDGAAEDASGVEICLFKNKPTNTASVSWLGKDNLGLADTRWVATCAPTTQEPIHIVSVMPHMHTTGLHMKSTINRKDGSKEILHDADFDFNYQRSYDKKVTLNPGESITTECTYSKPMSFGTATTAEMCYLFTYAYPAGKLVQADLWGGFAHGGASCLQ